jgi:hypothetical protein
MRCKNCGWENPFPDKVLPYPNGGGALQSGYQAACETINKFPNSFVRNYQ